MIGQPFEINHLCASITQRVQQGRFPGARAAANRDVVKPLRHLGQFCGNPSPVSLVAAFQLHGLEPDFAQNKRQGTRPFAAAPAVNEWCPVARFIGKMRFQHHGDIA